MNYYEKVKFKILIQIETVSLFQAIRFHGLRSIVSSDDLKILWEILFIADPSLKSIHFPCRCLNARYK